MKSIKFFTDKIALIPHTATTAAYIGRPVLLREFANNRPMALYELENGEYLARAQNGEFIEGPQKQ